MTVDGTWIGRRGAGLMVGPLLLGFSATVVAQEGREAVGDAPRDTGPQVTVFEERGMLTPQGQWVIEPSLAYVHSSALDVSIEGFTIIPALAIGLIDVSETERDTLTAAVALRYGLTDRLEVGLKIPWVYREQQVRRRDILEGTELERVTGSTGSGLGDVEFGLSYQFNTADRGRPFFIGNLKAKSRTGTDPFSVDRRRIVDEDGNRLGEIFLEQPTGSGFWAVQPSVTMIYPTDPAVLFANVSYLWNIERDVGPDYGTVDPGDAFGASLGMAISLNDRTSMSLGYDHSVVFRTRVENDPGLEPVFGRRQVGTLLWGVSHRLTERTSLNFSLGVGVTESAPDVQMTVRVPMRF